jgi:hypothetical protein
MTNNANKRHHLYIALFAGRAKEIYVANYNRINLANNQKAIEDQSLDAEVLQMVVNETAKSFFSSLDTAGPTTIYETELVPWGTQTIRLY